MQSQATRDTAPETALRRELHHRGVRFRLHRDDLPGCPDIVLVRVKVAVFVDGCFWHGCPIHFVAPKANRQWWLTKIGDNRLRDQRNSDALREMGWTPVRVWEHEDPVAVAIGLQRLWEDHR